MYQLNSHPFHSSLMRSF